jgi:hypothetical protein
VATTQVYHNNIPFEFSKFWIRQEIGRGQVQIHLGQVPMMAFYANGNLPVGILHDHGRVSIVSMTNSLDQFLEVDLL